jgi:hypothetical protein
MARSEEKKTMTEKLTRASDAEVALTNALLAVETLSPVQASVLLDRARRESRRSPDPLVRMLWLSYADLLRRRFGEFDPDPRDDSN